MHCYMHCWPSDLTLFCQGSKVLVVTDSDDCYKGPLPFLVGLSVGSAGMSRLIAWKECPLFGWMLYFSI